MKNRFLILIFVTTLIFTACSRPQSTFEKSLRQYLDTSGVDLSTLDITDVQLIETVNLANELDYREKVLQTKLQKEISLSSRYRTEGKPDKSAAHDSIADSTRSILAWLSEYRLSHTSALTTTMYHIVSFRAHGRFKNGGYALDSEKLAIVDPAGNVRFLVNKDGNIRTFTSEMFPDYKAFLEESRMSVASK